VDPFSLLLAAQAAVSFVKKGCEMLQEGRAIIDDFKSDAEGIVGEIKATIETVTGLWDWIQGLFKFTKTENKFTKTDSYSEQVNAPLIAQKPIKASPKRQDEPEVLQLKTIAGISDKLGEFFEIQKKLKDYYRSLEEASIKDYKPDQNSAIKAKDRVFVELQLEQMTVDIRETMVYAPKELKDFYSRFLAMYGKIEEEQEFARLQQVRRAKYKKWQRERLHNQLVDLWVVLAGATFVLAMLVGILWDLKIQATARSQFWLVS
jgi:hypothetical protein